MTQLTNVLIGLLDDLDLRARQAAVSLLRTTGDETAIPHLEAFRRVETVANVAESARKAVTEIRSRGDEAKPLAAENKQEARMKEMEERLDELESKIKSYEDKH